MVYSTNPDFNYETTETPEAETLPPARQELRVWLDRKQRAGKVVTLVKGFVGRDADLQELARLLKTKCGVGGAAKERPATHLAILNRLWRWGEMHSSQNTHPPCQSAE